MIQYKIEIYKDKRGKWRWRLTEEHTKNIVAASSQGFVDEQEAWDNIERTYRGVRIVRTDPGRVIVL